MLDSSPGAGSTAVRPRKRRSHRRESCRPVAEVVPLVAGPLVAANVQAEADTTVVPRESVTGPRLPGLLQIHHRLARRHERTRETTSRPTLWF